MRKINDCIRFPFIFFNGLFVVIGCMMIYGVMKISAYSQQQLEVAGSLGLGWAWVFTIGILCIAGLGVFAGRKENALALKIFAGFMVVGMIIMMIFGIIVVVKRNESEGGNVRRPLQALQEESERNSALVKPPPEQLKSDFESGNSETVKTWIDKEEMRELLNKLQKEVKCCGLVSAEDWGDDIPTSCRCNLLRGYGGYGGSAGSECKAKPKGTSGPSFIYKQTCGDHLFELVTLVLKIALGVCLGFAVTALLGLLMSLLMIHQIKRHDSAAGASFAMTGY